MNSVVSAFSLIFYIVDFDFRLAFSCVHFNIYTPKFVGICFFQKLFFDYLLCFSVFISSTFVGNNFKILFAFSLHWPVFIFPAFLNSIISKFISVFSSFYSFNNLFKLYYGFPVFLFLLYTMCLSELRIEYLSKLKYRSSCSRSCHGVWNKLCRCRWSITTVAPAPFVVFETNSSNELNFSSIW